MDERDIRQGILAALQAVAPEVEPDSLDSDRPLRDQVWNEVIGRLPDPSSPADPRSRLIYDEPKVRGYELMLDVWPGVFAYGILLVPKDIRSGERRPAPPSDSPCRTASSAS